MPDRPFIVPGWEVEGVTSGSRFFTAVGALLLSPSFLCFEGTSIAPDVWEVFKSNAIAPQVQIPAGTVWPKPRIVHMSATADVLRELSELAMRHAEPEICDHLHVYGALGGVLQWYDAFASALLLDQSVPESVVATFCEQTGARYRGYEDTLAD